MNVRAQIASVFHLDKCIGCHTCSIACKNIWTDRPGAEYMWWNNVETKPGAGYPVLWEDQEHHKGGWTEKLKLRSQNRLDSMARLFYNPNQPGLDDYYEPWTYDYRHLFTAPDGKDQPTAVPVSQVTGEQIELKAGPNWDDDLSGSPVYAANDVNFQGISEEERKHLFEIQRVAFMYLPRICNHCANPACVAACPSGAMYKRGEDGIVLANQEVCKGWRACIPACPYKKVYYNWRSSKSEKCLLCYPRLESGQAPACFHSCVGRIRYLGVLLYDADRIEEVARAPKQGLIAAQRTLICDPHDPKVIAAAQRNGISDGYLRSAQDSAVYKFVIDWKLALPLHSEFRTLPFLFYVPPLLPVMGKMLGDSWEPSGTGMFTDLEQMRLPIKFLANLFAAGNETEVKAVLRKLMAVRHFMRAKDLTDAKAAEIPSVLKAADLTPETAQAIYAMTTLADRRTRYGIPPMKREEMVAGRGDVEQYKGSAGLTIPPGPLSND